MLDVQMKTTNRFRYLDGLRAILAIMVIFEHLMQTFHPTAMLFEIAYISDLGFSEGWALFTPLSILFSGDIAVSIFLVLSGFVIAHSLSSKSILSGVGFFGFVVNRYIRFAFPILAVLLAVWMAWKCDLILIAEYSKEYVAVKPLINVYQPIETFSGLLNYALYQATFLFNAQYYPVLWTVSVELFGSLLVFGLVCLRRLKDKGQVGVGIYYFVFAVLAYYLSGHLFITFLVGVACLDIIQSKAAKLLQFKASKIVLLVICAVLFAYSPRGGNTHPLSVFEFGYHAEIHQYIVFAWGAGAWLLLLLTSCTLKNIFNNRLLIWMGHRSFGMYLIHSLVISTAGIFVYQHVGYGSEAASFLAAVATIAITLLLSDVFYRYIERPSLKLGHCIRGWLSSSGVNTTDKVVPAKLA